MSILMIPDDGDQYWPTLGPQVCQFIESSLVFGPGDLRGLPAVLDDEKRALIYRAYEVFPRGHPQAGRRRFKRVGLSLAKGTAKALALDTPLPTPTSWTTMGEVKIGDYLLGSDGKPCRVLAVSPVFHDHTCYSVEFSDRTSIVADAGHRWFTQTRKPEDGQNVYTTEEIRNTLHWHQTKPYSNHRIPLACPLELPEADLPIPPYTLGAWLGDGRNSNCMLTQGENDLAELESGIHGEGVKTGRYRYDNRAPNLWLNGITPKLRALGLLHNKHVPARYLRASFEQRLALFQGLMDTDGTAWRDRKNNACCAFVSKDKALIDGVIELARTLGFRPSLSISRATFSGKDYGPCYKIQLVPRDDIPAFRLKRKLEASKRAASKTSQALARTIRAVVPVEPVPVRCVAVDSCDHLYLAGEGMVPTHNTELAAWIAACELHPEAPVRCDGFDRRGNPLGRSVTDPFVVMVAYTEEQSDELAYGALRVILEEGPLRDDFDIGLQRIMRKRGDGKAVSLASAPSARDGARTTWQCCDETHWFTLPRLKQAHQTMMANLPKRKLADAWALEITTAPEAGGGSVAEETMEYAKAVAEGRAKDARLFYFHRQASDEHDLDTEEGARAAVIEASGPAVAWRDIDAIVELWRDPTTDRAYWERVWCNRVVKAGQKAFDPALWKRLAQADNPARKGDKITLGFDGAQFRDSTGLVATHITTGYQWVLGAWECPYNAENWQVPADEVDSAVAAAFEQYDVWRFYADPPYWETWIAQWAGRYGDDRVVAWWTNRRKPMTYALLGFQTAMRDGTISHSGDEVLARHIGNAHRKDLPQLDDEGKPLWLIQKERSDSPHKIDLAMAAVLSWEARTHALAAGVHLLRPSVYATRGILEL